MAETENAPDHELLTDIEWVVLDAVRSRADIAGAARAAGLDEATFRRVMSTAGEKVRMASAIAEPHAGGGEFRLPHLDPCPYCEILDGRFSTRSGPPAVIHADDDVFVFLAPAPMGGMPGHTLVTTRRHVPTVFDLTDDEAANLGTAVARTARMLRAALAPEGVLIQQNNGAAAFQTVPHIHFHVIPKVAGPFPPLEAPSIIPPDERAALAETYQRHW